MYKKAADQHSSERTFRSQDRVWVRNYRNNVSKWTAGKIVQQLATSMYEVEDNGGRRRCHSDQLRKNVSRERDEELIIADESCGDSPKAERSVESQDETLERVTQDVNEVPAPNTQAEDRLDMPIETSIQSQQQTLRRSQRNRKPPDRYADTIAH